jgi:hypothetical protein
MQTTTTTHTAHKAAPKSGSNVILMTRAQWSATPRELRFYSRGSKQRFVMEHTSRGICLLAVTITR